MLLRTLALDWPSLSSRYGGTAPFGTTSSLFRLVSLSSCCLILGEGGGGEGKGKDGILSTRCGAYFFFITIFSVNRFLLYSLALQVCVCDGTCPAYTRTHISTHLIPCSFLTCSALVCGSRPSRFRLQGGREEGGQGGRSKRRVLTSSRSGRVCSHVSVWPALCTRSAAEGKRETAQNKSCSKLSTLP